MRKMLRERTKALLREHGIRLSKRRGQPHVIDARLLGRMVGYAELAPKDTVLEIGAGTGNLTELLAREAGNVVAIESDARLVRVLRERLGERSNVEILHGDALKLKFPEFDKVVANLPYNISSAITFRLLEHDFELAVLMYQREFAWRLVASPGTKDYGRLTVNVYYRAEVKILEEVPPEAFVPHPKVKSTLVRLRPKAPPFEVKDEKAFADIVRALFQHRRQRARNALLHSFEEVFPGVKLPRAERRGVIEKIIPGEWASRRAADFSPEEFGKIADSIASTRPDLRA